MSFYGRQEFHLRFGHDTITWAVQWLILVNVAVFAVQLLLVVPFGFGGLPGSPITDWIEFRANAFLSGYLYTPLTYMFLHSGLAHLFFNMLMLYFFGPDVERALGTRQFLRFYLLCGALGVLANFVTIGYVRMFTDRPADIAVVGASGATLGVLVAFAIVAPERRVFLLPFPFPISSAALVVVIIFLNLITAAQGGTRTSVATHFGGMAVGFLYMKFFPKLTEWRSRWRRRKGPSSKDLEKLGEEIDNIFKFQDKDRR